MLSCAEGVDKFSWRKINKYRKEQRNVQKMVFRHVFAKVYFQLSF
jgi:hypothetical protein